MADERALPDATTTDLRSEDVEFEALVREVSRVSAPPIGNVLTPRTIVGEYRIEEVLGRGGCGTVYTAIHPVIGKRVAIKVLRQDLSSDPKAVARFVNEAQAVNRIAHPNIVDVFGFGELPDGRKYCVMEFVEGSTLSQRYRGRILDPLAVVELLEPVARALDAAHAQGIVHRDLKPANILVDSSGTPKLLDFGIAKMARDDKAVANTTETGMLLGTPAYMSPEQCRGLPVDARSDVYALGVIVYELLTGKRPISGENMLQLISQHIVETPLPPSHHRPELSAAIDGVVLAMLEKSPELRPSSASEAIAGLRSAVLDESASVGSHARKSGPADEPATQAISPAAAARVTASLPRSNEEQLVSTAAAMFVDGRSNPEQVAKRRVSRWVLAAVGVLGGSLALYFVFEPGVIERRELSSASIGADVADDVDDPATAATSADQLQPTEQESEVLAQAQGAMAPQEPAEPPRDEPRGQTRLRKTTSEKPLRQKQGETTQAKPGSAPESRPGSSAPASGKCDPPYRLDEAGRLIFKTECL